MCLKICFVVKHHSGINIVYTWCDGSDPAFQRQRNELCQKLGMPVQSDDDQLDASKRSSSYSTLQVNCVLLYFYF